MKISLELGITIQKLEDGQPLKNPPKVYPIKKSPPANGKKGMAGGNPYGSPSVGEMS